ncbi:MAG: NAD(P)/FAD-dependent oxidoreductase [Pseudomonadota bacterium]
MPDTDVIIIGGGHNGLVCACYLADAGLDVTVLERRSVVGGAAVTEEFYPGFRNSVASYTVSLLQQKIIDDLDLYSHGLEIVERAAPNFWPLGHEDGNYLLTSYDLKETQDTFARLSQADADRLPAYYEALEKAAELLRTFILEAPPNVNGGPGDIWRTLKVGNRLRRLGFDEQQLLADLFTKSAAEFLEQWFEHPVIIGAFAFDGVVGNYASPHAPGTAYVLLHHVFGNIGGRSGFWGHAIGGMGAITQAMAKAASQRGATIRTEASVNRIKSDDGGANGVCLHTGEELSARCVASNLNPKLMATMLDEAPPETKISAFKQRMKRYACHSATFRMNVALSELPDFLCRPGKAPDIHHKAGIIIGPDVKYLDRAYLDARTHGWSRAPVVEMLIPSTIDPTLAPSGSHVASLFCQHFSYDLPDGKSWEDEKQRAADVIIDTVTGYAPNFRSAIVGMQVLSPLDLEQNFGLVGGDIFHGRLSLDQMFSARPALGAADYRMPLKGLYLCGSGAHPGGGVTGAPGHNAAQAILRDIRNRRI